MRVAVLLFAYLLLMPLAASGQVELVVRLNDEADPLLLQSLETLRLQPGEATDREHALVEDVQRVRSVFRGQHQSSLGRRPGAQPSSGTSFPAYTLTVPDSSAFERLQKRWEEHPDVAYVQPNYSYELHTAPASASPIPDIPLADSLEHLNLIGASQAWSVTTGSEEVTIGFIDTGLYFDHPDLQGQVRVNPAEDANGNGQCDFFSADEGGDLTGRDDSDNGFADDVCGYNFVDRPRGEEPGPDPRASRDEGHAHGTAVAGVLAASLQRGGIAGIAPSVRLLPLRAFDRTGRGRDADIAAAIVYAADHGVDVLNMSFGDVYYSPLLREALRYADRQGVVLVASAGNDGTTEPHYPSDYEEVISVVWLNREGAARPPLASHGPQVHLGAPGSSIYTSSLPRPDEDAEDEAVLYRRTSGSSMAAPMVSGAAALLRSVDRSLSPQSIRSILTATATPLSSEGWNDQVGAGRLNIGAAVARALPARTEITSPENDSGGRADNVPIIGSAIDPSFVSYSLHFAEGYEDLEWQPMQGPIEQQVRRDTLGIWDTSGLPEGTYTIRLAVDLRTGRRVEVRHRYYLYRSGPEITLRLLDRGLIGNQVGVLADVETDQMAEVFLDVEQGGQSATVRSDRRARRHGLVWRDRRGDGGLLQLTIRARNLAGIESEVQHTVELPRNRMDGHFLEEQSLEVPAGYLMPAVPDFDEDGLEEIIFTQFEDGIVGDTLAFYEWDGHGFAPAHALKTDAIPRAVGNSRGNHLKELLGSSVEGTVLFEQKETQAFPAQRHPIDSLAAISDSLSTDDSILAVDFLPAHDPDSPDRLLDRQLNHWRLFQYEENGYRAVARLNNPTGAENARGYPNEFDHPRALLGDFTNNERLNILVGDADGDWIMYEEEEPNRFSAIWTEETDRFSAGAKFAAGDFDGSGTVQFVTHTRHWPSGVNEDGLRREQEPPFGAYYLWRVNETGAFERIDRFLMHEDHQAGAMAAADLSNDGRDELVLLSPPRLHVLRYVEGEGFQPVYHRSGTSSAQGASLIGRSITAADFSSDGHDEFVVAGSEGDMHHFAFHATAAEHPPPRWVEARPASQEAVQLTWRAHGADSVAVYRSPPDAPYEPAATTRDSSLVLAAPAGMHRYRLRAWYGEQGSPLSEERLVKPQGAARLAEVSYPDTAMVKLTFTQQLSESTEATQFALEEEHHPVALVFGENRRAVTLRFEQLPPDRAGILRWGDVRSEAGLPVADTSVEVHFPQLEEGTLIVEDWSLEDHQTLRVVFNEALDPAEAQQAQNYALRPQGQITHVDFDEEQPRVVRVSVAGTRLGPTGRSHYLHVNSMRSAAGEPLAPEGHVLDLSQPAEHLADVYVYPNPHHAGRHQRPVTIAGLPTGAQVQILSVDGQLVAEIDDPPIHGGVEWSLTDRSGRKVPPGVYLVRVEAPDEQPVLKKIAIIR